MTVIQIQRKLQIQIENQGKRLQMMFEKQIGMDDSKLKGLSSSSEGSSASLSNMVLPSTNENLEPSNEGHVKLGINRSTLETIPEKSSQDASTKQKGDDAKVTDEHELGNDQFAEPPTKRVKS